MLKRTAILAPLFFSAHLSAQTWIEDAQGQRYLLGDQLVSTTTEAYNYCTSKGLAPANVAQMRRALRQGKVTVDFVSVPVSEDAKTPFIKDGDTDNRWVDISSMLISSHFGSIQDVPCSSQTCLMPILCRQFWK